VLGVIELFTGEPRRLDAELLVTMSTLGDQIGQAVERRRDAEALGAKEARYRAMLDAALDCVVTMDHEGRVVDFNPAAERTFGYRDGDAVGRPMAELIVPPELRERHRRGLARYVATEEAVLLDRRAEITSIRADGTTIPVELTIVRSGIHPAALTEGGLRPALAALVARSTVPARLVGAPDARFPAPVEATAYFTVAAGLTNAARYAAAEHVEVEAVRLDDRMRVEIRDDGRGGADPTSGSGLRGLADRVAALDGRLDLVTSPG
jgi:PAS domain S-box-containing protein